MESSGIFPVLLPKHLQHQGKESSLQCGVVLQSPLHPHVGMFWCWGPEGAVPFTDPSQTLEDGICSLLCCRKEPCQNLQRDQICFPPPWLCSKCFKGAAQAGFTDNFVGFLAQTPNLNHRPGEVKTTTISLFSHTKAGKPQVI